MPKRFTLETDQDNSALSSNEQGEPILITQLKTYRISKIKNSFVIHELFRKQKPKLVSKFRRKKGQTINTVISDVKDNKIRIRVDYIDTRPIKSGQLITIQRNTRPRIPLRSLIKVQLIALVKVTDVDRNEEAHILAFSSGQQTPFTNFKLNMMRRQAIDMAVKIYIRDNIIQDPTVNYKDVTPPPEIFGEIIQERFQHAKPRRRKR